MSQKIFYLFSFISIYAPVLGTTNQTLPAQDVKGNRLGTDKQSIDLSKDWGNPATVAQEILYPIPTNSVRLHNAHANLLEVFDHIVVRVLRDMVFNERKFDEGFVKEKLLKDSKTLSLPSLIKDFSSLSDKRSNSRQSLQSADENTIKAFFSMKHEDKVAFLSSFRFECVKFLVEQILKDFKVDKIIDSFIKTFFNDLIKKIMIKLDTPMKTEDIEKTLVLFNVSDLNEEKIAEISNKIYLNYCSEIVVFINELKTFFALKDNKTFASLLSEYSNKSSQIFTEQERRFEAYKRSFMFDLRRVKNK